MVLHASTLFFMSDTSKDAPSRRQFLTRSGAVVAGVAAGGAAFAAPSSAAATTQTTLRFDGTVVLITGATSGIGEATARAFADEGASVFFCGRREDLGAEVEASIRDSGGEATYMQADVREEAQMEAFVSACVDTYGAVDVAFNNAGIEGPNGGYNDIAMEGEMGYHDLMRTNVDGVLYAMRYEIPVMVEQGAGVIINTGSVLTSRGSSSWGAYAASKHAVHGLSRSAAQRHAGDGLRILTLSPGATETDLLRRFYGGSLEGAGENHPMGRLAQPEDIAAMVLHLSSEGANFVSGANIEVDGTSTA